MHLELCILQNSTSTLRIFNNILSYVKSIPLSTILILRICPSFCLISVGSINFSLLDNGLCSKRRYFQFASKCLYFMLFTCFSIVSLQYCSPMVFRLFQMKSYSNSFLYGDERLTIDANKKLLQATLKFIHASERF